MASQNVPSCDENKALNLYAKTIAALMNKQGRDFFSSPIIYGGEVYYFTIHKSTYKS